MKTAWLLPVLLVCTLLSAQKPGEKAPDFIVHRDGGTIQSFTFPYMKKLVYLQFWTGEPDASRERLVALNHLARRYENATYRNAEGFEVVAIAVTTDLNRWKKDVKGDSLAHVTHCIANRGLSDDPCVKYAVKDLPAGFLVDETGTILLSSPRMIDIENALDEKRNIQPPRKDIQGVLAQASDRKDVYRYTSLYLFNHYGDSLAKTTTNDLGGFRFYDIKINQDFMLKVDNQMDFVTSDPCAIYVQDGSLLMNGVTRSGGFVFNIPARLAAKLVPHDTVRHSEIQMDVVKHLRFTPDGSALTQHDQEELAILVQHLRKSQDLKVEVDVHADTRLAASQAMSLSTRQASALRSFLHGKGIPDARISVIAKGSTEPRKVCGGGEECSEADHLMNRRVEIILYKD